ncbi:glycogen synthase GlgA [Uruburuella testudinis]|uniref:Glycogen synthase n=1 Tax=Uruburuella testudinis TaxID=1282863 RepID=A0ABY4DUM1_9NEIS|nr:glycogen synthase GlgA [Uruburuella testudinis]UOO82553.1 glycogen synthase GlgA [Uruburuella testudinis]
MKILHAASELFPLLKTGGLADVLGALPFAQLQRGNDVRVVLPYYPKVREALPDAAEVAVRDNFGGHIIIRYADYNGLGLYLIDAPHLFERAGNPYHDEHYNDYPDNVIRFGVLGWAAAALATGMDELWGRADVLHAHDWQAGLAPAYLHAWGVDVRSVFTIHNIAYQGMFQAYHLPELDLPWQMYHVEGLEFHGQISFLKAGLYYAGCITTVSPSYAEEITHEPAACGMQGLLQNRLEEGRLNGILNGVDEAVWNPQTDTALAKNYHLKAMQGKKTDKKAVQQWFGLPQDDNALLAVMVSRLTPQKGADLLLAALQDTLAAGGKLQFVLLGSGEPELEQAFRDLAAAWPQQVGVHIGYDEQLAHNLIAGGDAILIPSRFEPCGLTQLYGLKYGTLPIVRRTGGLADTVVHTDADTLKQKTATGFVFEEPSAAALAGVLTQALALWDKPRIWSAVRKQAMLQDFGWHKAAEHYESCYGRL